ncbi:MAG: dienelactone hydrolase family protein [Fermentimonas sp.]|jgi:dienelactone hydrolase
MFSRYRNTIIAFILLLFLLLEISFNFSIAANNTWSVKRSDNVFYRASTSYCNHEKKVIVDYLPNTTFLNKEVNWEDIIDGVRKYHEERLLSLTLQREKYWNRDFSSPEKYDSSVSPNRNRFREILGAVDVREPISMENGELVAETDQYRVREISWSVLQEVIPHNSLQKWPTLDVPRKVCGEGLLLEPKEKSKGFIIAIPDADQEPEMIVGLKEGVEPNSQFARHLAENGYTVIVPVIVDRSNRWSRGTNRSSRSWIYAQAYEMGRTITGYEIQKLEALIDWFQCQDQFAKVGLVGYGEGGLLAFYTAALNTRVDAVLVSGYFAPREEIWREPIYRNMWGLLQEFGDAEIASLITPRSLIVEYSLVPKYDPQRNGGKKIEPPAELWTHHYAAVASEFNRISYLTRENFGKRLLVSNPNHEPVPFGSAQALNSFMRMLGNRHPKSLSKEIPTDMRIDFDYGLRMGRMVEQMVGHTQLLLRDSEYVRDKFVTNRSDWDNEQWRSFFKTEMIGWTDDSLLPINARTKLVEKKEAYSCYEVLIDVLPHIEMWGVLTVPNGINNGEKRPVVVMQHGRDGNPYTALDENGSYYGIARRLAEQGFVVFTPFGNWTGETRFRWIDRIARPAKNTIWSTIGRQHQQLFRWFHTLPFVDPERVGFYGKSIGGQAASLIPSMLPEYALSINCAYFNESARKESSIYYRASFVYHVDSEMPMWNRAHRLEYAEMANLLIFPRPFMVEHGRKDGIAPKGWVEYEYGKVQRYYRTRGMSDRTEIDLHDGGHIIHAKRTVPFLLKHL